MAGEDTFDVPLPQSTPDIDSASFREQSANRVHARLQTELASIHEIVERSDGKDLQNFVIRAADDINRAVVGANDQEDIYSTPDTSIVHAFGMVIWRKPADTARLEQNLLNDLAEKWTTEKGDLSRLAKGVYFSEVLLHKYKNGNGRVARGLKLLLDHTREGKELTREDTHKVLGIGKESLTKTGENSYKINFNPDFERLVLGVAYFGLEKGLTQEQVLGELKLNGVMPEDGLTALASKLGVAQESLKEEFIKFMVVDSDLSWCDFESP